MAAQPERERERQRLEEEVCASSAPLGRLEAHLHDDRWREARTEGESDEGEGFLDAHHLMYENILELIS